MPATMPSLDHASPERSILLEELARYAIPLTAFLAVRAFAVSQADPAGAVESAFLGLLIGGVVAAIAALGSYRELAGTALLALTSIWITDYGPSRSALVSMVLAVGLALAAGRRWQQSRGSLPIALTVPTALAFQLLVRCDLLLPPLLDLRTLVSLLLLPTAAALAISLLAARHGARRGLFAAFAVAILAPGWNVTTTLALVSLAAGSFLGERTARPWHRALAGAVLVAAAGIKFPVGALFALGGLALALPGAWSWGALPAALLAAFFLTAGRGWPATLELGISGLLVVPALILAPAGDRRPALVGLGIALAGARLGAGPDVLAGGLALAALALPERGAAATLQAFWSGGWLAATSLLAAYPWLRETPREDALALLGLAPGWVALSLVVALVAGLGLGIDFLTARRPRWAPAPGHVAGLIGLIALAAAMPGQGLAVLGYKPVVLSDQRPLWSREVELGHYSQLVVESSLIRGAALKTGTPVARLQLLDRDERPVASWDLLAGEDTAEWAAARPDVADRPGFEAPPPWVSGLALDGNFFGRRFRARFPTRQPVEAVSVRISRHRQLPPQMELVIYGVELRR